MDLVTVPSILWRWRWVLVSVAVVSIAAAGLHLRSQSTTYQAQVRIQVTSPSDGNVALVDTGNPSNSTLRDDLTLTQNDFETVVKSAIVRSRVAQSLDLRDRDASYSVSVSPILDSNFLDLVVQSSTAELAKDVADAHAKAAIAYYGELRAKPAKDTQALLSAQLQSAKAALDSAPPDKSSESATVQLATDRATYQDLLTKYAEASLAVKNASQVSYIQITDPATLPAAPLPRRLPSLIALTVAGAASLGVLLSLILEAVFPPAKPELIAPDITRVETGANGRLSTAVGQQAATEYETISHFSRASRSEPTAFVETVGQVSGGKRHVQ